MKVQCEIEIDQTLYVQVCAKENIRPLAEAVNAVYGRLWIEACYDPYNEQTEKLAKELLPHMRRIKEILRVEK